MVSQIDHSDQFMHNKNLKVLVKIYLNLALALPFAIFIRVVFDAEKCSCVSEQNYDPPSRRITVTPVYTLTIKKQFNFITM